MNDELERGRILQAQHLAAAAAAHRDRRERIATAVLAGIVAHHGETKDLVSRATAAVAYADALSAELDKEAQS